MESKVNFKKISEIDNKIDSLQDEISRLKEEKATCVWEECVPAFIEKMEAHKKKSVRLYVDERTNRNRKSHQNNLPWSNADLRYKECIDDEEYIRSLTLMNVFDGGIEIGYNNCYEEFGVWEYELRSYYTELTREISDTVLVKVLPALLKDDTLFEKLTGDDVVG